MFSVPAEVSMNMRENYEPAETSMNLHSSYNYYGSIYKCAEKTMNLRRHSSEVSTNVRRELRMFGVRTVRKQLHLITKASISGVFYKDAELFVKNVPILHTFVESSVYF